MQKVENILNFLGIPFVTHGQHRHTTSGWLNVGCPWCGLVGHYRLGINKSYVYCHCWACGPHDLVKTLSELSRRPVSEVKRLFGGVQRSRPKAEETERPGKLVIPSGLIPLLDSKPHCAYLRRRGLEPASIAALWRVQAIAHHQSLAWRLFIPIYLRGEVVSWTTRSISKSHPLRYRAASANEEKFNHRHLLYGEDYCTTSVVVCEGPTDVWRVGPGAVATFGKSFTRPQVRRIVRFTTRTVCYDKDGQGQAQKLCRMLEVFPGNTFNANLVTADDPGDATGSELRALRALCQ